VQLCTARSAVLNAGDYKKKLDRATGELLVAEKTKVDMDKNSLTYDRPQASSRAEDVNTKVICPAALGTKDEQPAAYSPDTGLFYVSTNHVCMDRPCGASRM
jgi:lanthanide-dependent methanol dehydrogenase